MQKDTSSSKKQLAASSESNQRIYDFMKSHPIGVLATVDPNAEPHAAVIYYSVEQDFTISFITKRDTKKHDNLQHKNHVMLVAFEAFTQATVQITGVTTDITDEPESQEAFQKILQIAQTTSDSGLPPISKLYAGHYVAYKLKPVQIRMAIFMRPEAGGYDMYETIDFNN